MHRPVRPCAALLAALLSGLLLLSACGSDGSSGKGGGSEKSADSGKVTTTADGTTIDITLKGTSVSPAGKLVKVKAGLPITLRITADKAGELHVHSSPEQHVEFPQGTSEKVITIDQPGVVDLEDHALGKLIAQLQVR